MIDQISLSHVKITEKCCKTLLSRSWLVLFTLTYFFLYITFPCFKIKVCYDHCFSQQTKPKTIVQWYILCHCSSRRIGFSMNDKPCWFKYLEFQSLSLLQDFSYWKDGGKSPPPPSAKTLLTLPPSTWKYPSPSNSNVYSPSLNNNF